MCFNFDLAHSKLIIECQLHLLFNIFFFEPVDILFNYIEMLFLSKCFSQTSIVSFHAIKDEMFLRQTLQRQAASLQHASVNYMVRNKPFIVRF